MAKQPEFEPQFRIYPRKPAAVFDDYGRMPPTMKRVEAMVKKMQAAAKSTGRKRPRPVIPGPQSFARIKTLLSTGRLWLWRAAGQYLVVNRPGQEQPWEPFGPHGPIDDPREIVGQWQQAGDDRAYKLVISPEDAEGIDLQAMAREIMARLDREKFLTGAKGPLEWVAAAHYDTEHPHVHLVIRGVAGGQEFRPPFDFAHGAIQRHAADVMTEQLNRKKEQNHVQRTSTPEVPRGL